MIEFLGFASGEPLWDLVRDSLAVVLPSEWYETRPMSVLEAYALGKPVIGARIGGIPELVVEGETGFTFDSGDVKSLSEQITKISSLPASRLREIGRFAREHVQTHFTPNRYRDAMLDLYRKLGRADVGSALIARQRDGCPN